MLKVLDPTVVCIVLVLFVVLIKKYAFASSRMPSLPGPPADPLIGHLRAMPTSKQSERFHEWCQLYGDIIQLRIPGISIIVLGSDEMARELLEKRGSKYSSRPPLTVLQLMGWGDSLIFMPYGKRFMKHRRIIQGCVSRDEVRRYYPLQVRELGKALKEFLDHPSGYAPILERYALGTIVSLTYGHNIEGEDDVFVRFNRNMNLISYHPGSTGTTIVDLFPFLQYFPSWFPGTYYANWARKMRPLTDEVHDWPFDRIVEQREGHRAPASTKSGTVGNWDSESVIGHLVRDCTSEQMGDPEHMRGIKGIGATLVSAGAETTHISSRWFLLLMTANPEVQKKGQEEVDAVTGGDRLPTFDDRESMPYVDAIVQEVLRWHPAVPLGVPHVTTEDDVFQNMFIPKGSIVIASTRSISLDERVYKDPHIFRPERFLPKSDGGGGEPAFTAAFGYGRRICPGQWLADNALWLLAASMLAVFDMVKARDVKGNEIELTMEVREGMVHTPAPFASVVKIRSPKAASLIHAIA